MSPWLPYGDAMKTNNATIDEWWTSLSSGEKDFIRSLMRMIQGAKNSQVIEVARAARKWEGALTFFFKVRLKNQRPRWRTTRNSAMRSETISYPLAARSQPGVSPGRD